MGHHRNAGRLGILRISTLSLTLSAALVQPAHPQESRRAIPVTRDDIPTGRAVPLDPPTAPAVPAPTPEVEPGITLPNTDSGEIRIAPQNSGSTPDQTQFDVANGLFSREMYEMAAQEFELYLQNFPRGADRQAALYRLATSYWNLKKIKQARDNYELLVIDYSKGEFVANAAFRLGDIYLADQNYKAAIPMFEKAAMLTKESPIAAEALYKLARAMESSGRKSDTVSVYHQLLTISGKNPYRDEARFALAERYAEQGRSTDALKQYDALAKETENGEARARAFVRAAMLATQMNLPEKAAAYYTAAAKVTNGGKWRGFGVAGSLELSYTAQKYKTVIASFTEMQSAIPPEVMPSALLLVANSQRQLKQYDAAVRTYERLIESYPKAPEKAEAALRKLDCLSEMKSPNLIAEIDRYAAENPGSEKTLQAVSLKADYLMQKERFDEAAEAYLSLADSKADPALRAQALFKGAASLASAQKHEKAVELYSKFLAQQPKHTLAPSVYIQRALAYEKLKNTDAALADFEAVVANFPESKERELAMRHKALLYGQKENTEQMATAFRALLKEYPDSPAAGLASYGIGTAEFDKKSYQDAVPWFEKARLADKDYSTKASFRLTLCYYFLQDKVKLAKEIDAYTAAKATPPIPSEVTGWLGETLASEGKSTEAAKYLRLAAGGKPTPQTYLALGRSELKMGNAKAAVAAMQSYLKSTTVPKERAEGLLLLGEAQIGMKAFAEAKAAADEALSLQPEGRLNAEGRMLLGSAELASGQFLPAAQAFVGVAALFDDPVITPKALAKAAEAYTKAGKPEEARKMLAERTQRYPNAK